MIHRLTIYDDINPKTRLDFFDEIPSNLMNKHVVIRLNDVMEFKRFDQITEVVKYILTQTFICFKIDEEINSSNLF